MNNEISTGKHTGKRSVATLVEELRRAVTVTTADRSAKDLLLDELQDVVGLSGQMTTERDIMRRAEKMLQGA
jgi:hypothetical protein